MITFFLISFAVLLIILVIGTIRWIWKHLTTQIQEKNPLKETKDMMEYMSQPKVENLMLKYAKETEKMKEQTLKSQIELMQETQPPKKSEFKECTLCGARNPEQANVCRYCGEDI